MFIITLTLITSTFVPGTLAKYISTASGTASASVAYWGFTNEETTLNISNLFSDRYYNESDIEKESPKVIGGANVIAPGTSGSASFSFPYEGYKNAPEVAYDFTVSVAGSSIGSGIENNPDIKWSLNSTSESSYGSWNKLMQKIIRLSGDIDAVYDAEGQQSSAKYYPPQEIPVGFRKGNNHTIYWKWDSADSPTSNNYDLTLANGNKDLNGNVTGLDEVILNVTISAKQVD